MLKKSMGHDRFNKAVGGHRYETAEVIQLRKEAIEDTKEPPELMPVSYQDAKDRAQKVAAEVRRTAVTSDSLATSVAMANFALLATMVPPSVSPASISTTSDIAEASQRFACLKRKRKLSNASSPTASKSACLEACGFEGDGQASFAYDAKLEYAPDQDKHHDNISLSWETEPCNKHIEPNGKGKGAAAERAVPHESVMVLA